MQNNKIELVIAVKDAFSQGFNRITTATKAYKETLHSLNGTANQVSQTMRNMFFAVGGYSVFNRAISEGYKFNSVIEDTRVGLASLMYSMNEWHDAQGNAVTGNEAFNASLRLSEEIQGRLRIAGL